MFPTWHSVWIEFKPLPALSKLSPVLCCVRYSKSSLIMHYIRWVVITNMDILLIFLFKQYKDLKCFLEKCMIILGSSYCLRITALNQTKATEMMFTARLIKTRSIPRWSPVSCESVPYTLALGSVQISRVEKWYQMNVIQNQMKFWGKFLTIK